MSAPSAPAVDPASPSPAGADPFGRRRDVTALDAETDALLRLVFAGGASAPLRTLLEVHGDPVAALSAGPVAWREAGLDAAQIRALSAHGAQFRDPREDGASFGRTRDWLRSPDRRLIGWHDPDYPPLLRQCASPPPALFIAGDPTLLWLPGVAVVGSRGPSAGGRDHARSFARTLAEAGLVVVSGMAAGIDRAAHEAALDAGRPTVAVLGTGPDVPYPRQHAGLLTRIASHGVVVSEHPPGTGPLREHFPSRNRIIAGLALGTLVVEAAVRSGALITARLAAEAGREVFALPGSIHNPMARGCHRLIRDGAALVESPDEIIAALGPLAGRWAADLRLRLGVPTVTACEACPADASLEEIPGDDPTGWDADTYRLWQALGHDPTDMDRLVERTGLTAATLSSMLLVMELQGRVVHAHGRYARTTPPHLTAPPSAG